MPSTSEAGTAKEHKDFFISYTSADREWAEWIALELEKAGDISQIIFRFSLR
jgi:hypothetical protein